MYNKVVREGQLVPLFTNCFGEPLGKKQQLFFHQLEEGP